MNITENERIIIMEINELKTNVNNYSAYPVMQNKTKEINTSNIDNIEEQIVSNNTDTFTFSKSSDELTGIYSINSVATTSITITEDNVHKLPTLIAAKRAGISVDSNGSPIIHNNNENKAFYSEMDKIENVTKNIYCKPGYKYSQTTNDYGVTNPKGNCARFALATAKSIKYGGTYTPDKIKMGSNGVNWSSNGAIRKYCDKEEALLAINAQLSLGNPALIYVKSSEGQHWATVTGRNANGSYTIIDPWDGTTRDLTEMEHYTNENDIAGYAIISTIY